MADQIQDWTRVTREIIGQPLEPATRLQRRVGVVASLVVDGHCDILLGGVGEPIDAAVLESAGVLNIDDVVVLDVWQGDLLVLGRVGDPTNGGSVSRILFDEQVASNNAVFVFDDIPQTMRHLEVIWTLRHDTAGGNRVDLRLRDSADNIIGTSLDSYLVLIHADGTRTDIYASAAVTNYQAGHIGASRLSTGTLTIPDYSGTGFKDFTGVGTSYGTAANTFANWSSGGAANAGASVHRVDLQCIGGLFAGGRVWLYGTI